MANQLANESSLYLNQHKENPVNWLPWSQDAFDLAKKENKPIFLSIGYSACHWCHVMAHECFEDEDVAKLMNENFINIKVDKEERPDIDQIYQTAHFIFSRRPGGWPLSVFLTPEQEPYYIGTYFPKISKYNLPGFPELIKRLSQFYKDEKDLLINQTKKLKEIIKSMEPLKVESITINKKIIDDAILSMSTNFDEINGGFGSSPKFPNEPILRFLVEQQTPITNKIVKLSLEKILYKGLFDHIEGGFYRYCVDTDWTIPHYEKMLYNTGQLVELYSYYYQNNQDKKIKDSINLTINWLIGQMKSKEGGFYASLDADSINKSDILEEGAYYNWSLDELKKKLTFEEFSELSKWFELEGTPNFEGKLWHLNLKKFDGIGKCNEIKKKLNKIRQSRIKPGLDKKIITSWNSLLLKSLLVAGDIFNEPDWIELAQKSIDFIYENLYQTKKLKLIYINGKPMLNAYLDDYTFLLDALIHSIEIKYREKDLIFAIELGNILKENFQSEEGAYYFTEHSHEKLFDRQMIAEDNAIPSGNGLACLALQKLSEITSNLTFSESAEKAMLNWNSRVENNAHSYPSLLRAYSFYLGKKSIIFIRGTKKEIEKWKDITHKKIRNKSIVIFLFEGEQIDLLSKNRPYKKGGVAYLCINHSCLPPIYSAKELLSYFDC